MWAVPESGIRCSQEFFLIRHATTDMAGSLCGHSDPPLNEIGRAQASALAVLLRSWNVRRLYTSDLQRALQTAQPLADMWGIPVVTRSALREMSFGEWEKRRWSDIRSHEPDIRTMESSRGLGAPGGEPFACFRHRTLRAVKEILADCNGELAALVTHLGVMRVVLNELSSAESAWDPQQRIDYCAIYKIRLSGTICECLRLA
jgi:broad specificity phosphatase PhoE